MVVLNADKGPVTFCCSVPCSYAIEDLVHSTEATNPLATELIEGRNIEKRISNLLRMSQKINLVPTQ